MPTAVTLRTEQAYPPVSTCPNPADNTKRGPRRRTRSSLFRSRGASVPLSLGGTWGGTTTPMRLDAAAPRSLLTTTLRHFCPICTLRHDCPDCRGTHTHHTNRGGQRQQPDRPGVRHRLHRRDGLRRRLACRDLGGRCGLRGG